MGKEKVYIAPVGEGVYSVNTGDWRINRPILNQDKCVKCGICYLYCPVFSIERIEGRYEINYDFCKGCGICSHECKVKAIDMVPEGGRDNA